MPGASPTISSRAESGPKAGTGALNQSGCSCRKFWRNICSRGQSGQSRAGVDAGVDNAPGIGASRRDENGLVFEIVVVSAGTGALRRGATLQELRCVRGGMTRLAPFARLTRRALGRIASNLRLQLDDVEEDIGLPAELIGNH